MKSRAGRPAATVLGDGLEFSLVFERVRPDLFLRMRPIALPPGIGIR